MRFKRKAYESDNYKIDKLKKINK